MVDKWGSLIDSMENMDQACTLLGSCTLSALMAEGAKSAQSKGLYILAIPPALAQILSNIHHSLSAASTAAAGVPVVGDAAACDKCKLTVLEIRMVIASEAVQQQIVNVTKGMCNYFAPYETQCRSAVDVYSPAVFEMVDKYFQPDAICTELRICTAKSAVTMVTLSSAHEGHGFLRNVYIRAQRIWGMLAK